MRSAVRPYEVSISLKLILRESVSGYCNDAVESARIKSKICREVTVGKDPPSTARILTRESDTTVKSVRIHLSTGH